MSSRIFTWALFAVALAIVMHPWISSSPPLTVNSENIPEINYIWLLRNLIEQGDAFTAWHPKALAGEAVQSHLLYPLYWLVAMFSSASRIAPETLYKVLVFIDLWLGCIFISEFMLRLSGHQAAGLTAGLIFGLIPGHMNTIEGLFIKVSWLSVPLILWLYEREFGQSDRINRKGTVRLGLAIGLMSLASIQIPLMMTLILPAYFLFREWSVARIARTQASTPPVKFFFHSHTESRISRKLSDSLAVVPWRTWLKWRVLAWLAVGGVALGMTASYYIPVLIEQEHLAFTRFTDHASAGTIDISFILYMLTGRWKAGFSPNNFHEVTWYLGDVALLLALIGLTGRSKQGLKLFIAGLGLLSLLLLVGDSLGSVPNLVYTGVEKLPVINGVLRHSFRWVLPLSLSLAVLAGFGAARLTGHGKLSKGIWAHSLLIGFAALLTFDYFPISGSFRVGPDYLRQSELAAIAWLNQQETGYRYFTPFANGTDRTYHLVYGHHLVNRPAVWDDQYLSHYVSKRAYTFFAGLNVQFPDLESGLLDPLFLQMLDLGAVKHIVLFLESYNHRDLFRTATALGVPVVFEQDEVRILLNRNAKGLMQLYPKTALYLGDPADDEQLRNWLPRLTPQGIALVERLDEASSSKLVAQVDYLLPGADPKRLSLSPGGQAKLLRLEQTADLPVQSLLNQTLSWTRPKPTRAEAQVYLNQPVILVFAEAWYPGWRVTVDGVAQPLLRANYVFQGVILPPGQHEVVFEYRRPIYTWIGGGISLVTLIVAFLSLLSRTSSKST